MVPFSNLNCSHLKKIRSKFTILICLNSLFFQRLLLLGSFLRWFCIKLFWCRSMILLDHTVWKNISSFFFTFCHVVNPFFWTMFHLLVTSFYTFLSWRNLHLIDNDWDYSNVTCSNVATTQSSCLPKSLNLSLWKLVFWNLVIVNCHPDRPNFFFV